MKSSIPLNAFSSVTVQGLVVKDNGTNLNQTFHRGVVIPGEQVMMTAKLSIRPDGIPPRPPSLLPPPGDMHLEVSLGEELGSGRVGSVRAVNILSPNTNVMLPRLVMKISNRKRSKNLAQEAWFYEELEQLQGVSVPRCYGFFEARLEEGHKASTWDPYRDDSYDSEEEDIEEDTEKKDTENNSEQFLSILILERLGSHMPIGEPIDAIMYDVPVPAYASGTKHHSFRKDVYELFDDLARLGIEPLDIRYDNIISAGEGYLDDSSGAVCPNHGHVHDWRLVDFDLARKTNGTVESTVYCTGTWLRTLFSNLVVGCVVEPWD